MSPSLAACPSREPIHGPRLRPSAVVAPGLQHVTGVRRTRDGAMSVSAAVELAAVTKLYGPITAVDGISLRIPGGTYCCLLGPSGCGKTSTLRMIAGHEAGPEGDITLGPAN